MPRGSKSKYTSKQKRKAEHIEEGYEKRGTSKKEAERRAWASVNKEIGAARRAEWPGQKRKQDKLTQRREKGGPQEETLTIEMSRSQPRQHRNTDAHRYLQALLTKSDIELKLSQCKIQ